jgi:hypothetical protein
MVMVGPVGTDQLKTDVFVIHHDGMHDTGLAKLLHHAVNGGWIHAVGCDQFRQLRLGQWLGVRGQGAKDLETVGCDSETVTAQRVRKFLFRCCVDRRQDYPFFPWAGRNARASLSICIIVASSRKCNFSASRAFCAVAF